MKSCSSWVSMEGDFTNLFSFDLELLNIHGADTPYWWV